MVRFRRVCALLSVPQGLEGCNLQVLKGLGVARGGWAESLVVYERSLYVSFYVRRWVVLQVCTGHTRPEGPVSGMHGMPLLSYLFRPQDLLEYTST